MLHRLLSLLCIILLCGGAGRVLASIQVETLRAGLAHPWSLAFLPGQQGMLMTLRAGQLLWLADNHAIPAPVSGVPAVWAKGQGGLLEVLPALDFAHSRRIWLSFAEAGEKGKAGTAVGVGRLSEDFRRIEQFRVVFRQQPKLSEGNHFGGRMAFDRQGRLYVALGENNQRSSAQDVNRLQGKVVRLDAESGQALDDNPWAGAAQGRAEIWTLGHRNPQGLALNPWSGEMWLTEHGPRGGDEINILHRGKNYGWPVATHGINYSGFPIPEARGRQVPGTEPATHYWEHSPALSGMAFYSSDTFPVWKGKLFLGALKAQSILMLSLQGNRVVEEERILEERRKRIRDVRVGPDGWLYVLTDEPDGELLRVGTGT